MMCSDVPVVFIEKNPEKQMMLATAWFDPDAILPALPIRF